MSNNIFKVLGNYKRYLYIVFFISVVVVTEIFLNSENLFLKSILVESISNWENVYTNNITIQENDFYLDGGKGYVVIPLRNSYDNIQINLTTNSTSNIIVRLYYSDGDGFKTASSLKKVVDTKTDVVDFSLKGNSGRIKLVLCSADDNASITVSNINLYKDILVYNAILLVKLLCIFIIVLSINVLIIALLRRIITGTTEIATIYRVIIGSFVVSTLILFLTKSADWAGYFVYDTTNTFMDYFNMLALLGMDNPYSLESNYPPLCFVFLKIMHLYLYGNDQLVYDPISLRNSNAIAMMGLIGIITISIVILYRCITFKLRDKQSRKYGWIVLISGPMLFLIERGNLMLISLVFLMIYYSLYDSENKKMRYIAYVALAISSSIKIYPAIFGMLTLKNKKSTETLHLILIGIVVFIAPFFCFDGIDTFVEFVNGLHAAADVGFSSGAGYNYSLANFVRIIGLMLNVDITTPTLIRIVVIGVLLLISFFNNIEWENLFLLATACIWFPDFSYTYTLTLYIPCILAFINNSDKEGSVIDAVLLALIESLLILPMMPWIDDYISSDSIILKMGWSTFIINIVIWLIVIRVITNNILRLFGKMNIEKKRQFIITALQFSIVVGFSALVLISSLNRNYNDDYSFKGDGSEGNPYKIETVEDWMYLQEIVNDGDNFEGAYFEQTADLQFDGKTTVYPIGWGSNHQSFAGIYDGKGFSISNYYSVSDCDENMGLFGTLSGTVVNLNVENCNIGGQTVGGIAYEITSTGKVINCSVNGLLWGYKASGIAALNYGVIENSVAFVAMDVTKEYGISEVYSSGGITNSYSNILQNTDIINNVDGNTLTNLNSYVEFNNMDMRRDYDLCNWKIIDGVIKLEE